MLRVSEVMAKGCPILWRAAGAPSVNKALPSFSKAAGSLAEGKSDSGVIGEEMTLLALSGCAE